MPEQEKDVSEMILNCEAVRKLLGYPGSCCDSCHDDASLGYFDLIELYETEVIESPVVAIVCCGVLAGRSARDVAKLICAAKEKP